MSKSIIDTNLLIRFLVEDDKLKASKVADLLVSSEKKVLLDIVFAEIVWLLSSFYSLSKEDIVQKLRSIIHAKSIYCDKKLFDGVLSLWEANNISFVDAYIAAKAETDNLVIYSYDKDFDKIKTVTRKEP